MLPTILIIANNNNKEPHKQEKTNSKLSAL